MTRGRLTDEEIGAALLRQHGEVGEPVRRGTGAPEGRACVHEDRFWDIARGALDPDLTGRILDHALECPDCSLALRVARETFAVSHVSPEAPRSTTSLASLWDRLTASVLRPAPAFVYLLLLLLSFPLYRVLTTTAPALPPTGASGTRTPVAPGAETPPAGAETPPASVSPIPGGSSVPAPPSGSAAHSLAPGLRSLRVLRLTGDLSLRGGGAQSAPLRIHLGEGEALVLKLFPDVEDLPKNARATLLVRVLDGETVVAATTRRVTDLEKDQSLSLLLDRPLLHSGTTYHVELIAGPPAVGSGAAESPTRSSPSAAPASPILRQSFLVDQG